MKRWILMCNDCGWYAVYSSTEPTSCIHCGLLAIRARGFRKVKGIPVAEVLRRGIYKAPIIL